MRHSFIYMTFVALVWASGLAAQDSAPIRYPVEGNWAVRWHDVQDEDTPSELRVTVFHDRVERCDGDRMANCQFGTVVQRGHLNLNYLIAGGGSYFVRGVQANPAGAQMDITHAHGLHGHWGGTEAVSMSGPNTMTGQWQYNDTAGQSTWQRIVPLVQRVTVLNPSGLSHMRASERVSDRHVKMVFDASLPAWSLDQPFPDQRPWVTVRITGRDLWGFQTATLLGDTTGIEVSPPRVARDPAGQDYLEVDLTFWPGARAGRHVLDISGTPVILDLELNAGDLIGRASIDVGPATAARPYAASPDTNPMVVQHDLTATLEDVGSRPFTEVEATFRTTHPLVLLGAQSCQNTGPLTVVCRASGSGGRFNFGFSYAIQPVAGHQSIASRITMRARALDPVTGTWVNAGRSFGTVHVRNCDAALRNELAQMLPASELQAIAAGALQPVADLPGKRLFPGPRDDDDADPALTSRVEILTNTLASNKGLDAWLFAQARAAPSVFARFDTLSTRARGLQSCTADQALTDDIAAARALLDDLRRNRAEIQSTYLGVAEMVTFNEKIVEDRLRGFSGWLPPTLRTVLGVGGSAEKPRVGSNIFERVLHEFSQNGFGWALTELGLVSATVLEQTAEILKVSSGAKNLLRAPSFLGGVMVTAQAEISVVDMWILLELQGRADNIKAWMEAEPYTRALLARYDALDESYGAALRQMEAASNACTCRY
ncbi:hypothetical protein AB3Y40_11285 [Yoonia sp. R2331]|uniref:hypothetical protein n=1 Tax=Yoonia sp. R2331 TaxID=3237238 RepID=UPI0034E41775